MSVFYTINFIGLIVLHGFPYNEATQRLIPSPMMSQRKLFVLKKFLVQNCERFVVGLSEQNPILHNNAHDLGSTHSKSKN